jgi:carnitine-CoA ligase
MPLEQTFAYSWSRAVLMWPDRPFLVWESSSGQVTQWSYAAFDRLVDRVAGTLHTAGAGPQAGVHLALTNSPAFVAIWLAAVRLGSFVIPCDPHAAAPEIAHQLQRTKPAVGVASMRRLEDYRQAASVKIEMFSLDEDDVALEMFDGSAPTALEDPALLDTAAIMFTSGTTSTPKGVVITQANYAFAGEIMAAAADLGPDDRQLVVLPLFHANAQYYSFASAIAVGASVALMSGFSASRFTAQAARHAATHASLFAAPMRMILARGAFGRDDLRLRHVWYAQNVTGEQYRSLSTLLRCRPRQLYGMTETIPAVLTAPAQDADGDGSMGRPTPGCAVKLTDVDGDGVGELLVGGRPGLELFREYLDDPATTAQSFTEDGWFRTADLARCEAGRYYFAGRRNDVLKVAGENVSLPEVEAVLAEHPSVFEAAVVGRPDPIRDEVPVAYVVTQEDIAGPTADDLAQWCAARLSPLKRPRDYIFVDELPRTSVGKIRKFLLR